MNKLVRVEEQVMERLVELNVTNNAGLVEVEEPETMANAKKGKVTGSKKGKGASN